MSSTLAFTNFWHGGGQGLTEQVAKVAFSAGYQAGHAKAWDEAMEAYDRATKGAKEGE